MSVRGSAWQRFAQGVVVVMLGLFLLTPAVAQDGSKKSADKQDKSETPVFRKVKTRAQPMYPELARRMKLSGVVKLELTIAPDGKVKSVKVLGGHPLLADAAMDAVRRWVYEPAHEQTVQVVDVKFSEAE